VFADIAKPWKALDGAVRVPLQVDVGAGLRLAVPGGRGVLRVDAATGLRDGKFAVSAGWQAPWPH
jgi:hypothetical protein